MHALTAKEKSCAVAPYLRKKKREIGHALLWYVSHLGVVTVRSARLRKNRGCEGFEQKGLPDW